MAGATNGRPAKLDETRGNRGRHVTFPGKPTPHRFNTLVIAIYALYVLGYFTVVTALIGVVIAYVKAEDADPVAQSHFRFQIRTFWIGLLYNVIGIPLCLVLIGFPIIVWWFVWSVIRIAKGGLLALENKPIANPRSWLFG